MNTHSLRYNDELPFHRQPRRHEATGGIEGAVRCYDLSPSAPEPRDPGVEYASSIGAAYDNMDKEAAVNRGRLFNGYASLQDILTGQGTATDPSGNFTGALDLLGQIQPKLSAQSAAANTAQRGADIADVERYGAQAVNAIQSANPQQKALLDALNADALGGLGAGGGLTPFESRQIAQGKRSAQAARGFGMGQNDVTDEVLAQLQGTTAKQAQQRGFATQIAGLNQATSVDPLLAITGRASSVPGQAGGVLQGAQGYQQQNNYDPLNGYMSDVFNTNYNADAAARIAGSNNAAGVLGGGLSAL